MPVPELEVKSCTVRELNAGVGADGWYLHSHGFIFRVNHFRTKAGQLQARRIGGEGWIDVSDSAWVRK